MVVPGALPFFGLGSVRLSNLSSGALKCGLLTCGSRLGSASLCTKILYSISNLWVSPRPTLLLAKTGESQKGHEDVFIFKPR